MQMLRDILRYRIDECLLGDLAASLAAVSSRIKNAELVAKLDLALATCKSQSALLRETDAAEQSLIVADWVRNTGWLDAIIAVIAEGIHQHQVDGSQDKLVMAGWLIDRHQPQLTRYQSQLPIIRDLTQ